MSITKDKKIKGHRVLITKLWITNFNNEVLILICKEEIIFRVEGKIISMVIGNQDLMSL